MGEDARKPSALCADLELGSAYSAGGESFGTCDRIDGTTLAKTLEYCGLDVNKTNAVYVIGGFRKN